MGFMKGHTASCHLVGSLGCKRSGAIPPPLIYVVAEPDRTPAPRESQTGQASPPQAVSVIRCGHLGCDCWTETHAAKMRSRSSYSA
jgi:hypothetical protein